VSRQRAIIQITLNFIALYSIGKILDRIIK
jgi:hypothetical protein